MNRIERKWDIALWGIIYMLPILTFMIVNMNFMSTSVNQITFNQVMEMFGGSSPIAELLKENIEAIMGITLNQGFYLYLTWLLGATIMHLFIDALLLIPRLLMKLGDKIV